MSYLSKNPDVWHKAPPEDEVPPPAPVRLSILPSAPDWYWSLDEGGNPLDCGMQHSEAAAIEAGRAAADRLGLRRVWDGWTSPPDQAFAP